jgi:hypothetical protein
MFISAARSSSNAAKTVAETSKQNAGSDGIGAGDVRRLNGSPVATQKEISPPIVTPLYMRLPFFSGLEVPPATCVVLLAAAPASATLFNHSPV